MPDRPPTMNELIRVAAGRGLPAAAPAPTDMERFSSLPEPPPLVPHEQALAEARAEAGVLPVAPVDWGGGKRGVTVPPPQPNPINEALRDAGRRQRGY